MVARSADDPFRSNLSEITRERGGSEGLLRLRRHVEGCPVLDHHCHAICDGRQRLEACVSESQGEARRQARNTLASRRAVRRLSELFGCKRSFDAVQKARDGWTTEQIARSCFERTKIRALLIDDGLVVENMWSLEKHKEFVPCVLRVARIESIAEQVLFDLCSSSKGSIPPLLEFQMAFTERMRETIQEENVVGLKTIAAYRCGLSFVGNVVSITDLEESYCKWTATSSAGKMRLEEGALISWCVSEALRCAIRSKKDLPLQIHTGFGDTDLDLQQSNPLLLRNLLENQEFGHLPVVILHAGYPFTQEAGYLCSVYKNCFLDLGLAIPMLSKSGIERVLEHALELCPSTKIMFSTDGHFMPEGFFIAVADAKEAIHSVLEDLLNSNEITEDEAIEMASGILWENACRLYGIDFEFINKPVARDIAPCKLRAEFVRVLWCDAAGISRCRVIPASAYGTASELGLGLTESCMALPAFGDVLSARSGLTVAGETYLVPDTNTLKILPWKTNHAIALGDMKMANGEGWKCCPRAALKTAMAELKKMGMQLRVGFEIEFILLKAKSASAGMIEPVDDSVYCSARSFDSVADLMDCIIRSLKELGIEVCTVHAESARGQFEIATQHSDALNAADCLLLTRLAIASIALQYNYEVTFLPKVFPQEAGSGCHMNISLWDSSLESTNVQREGDNKAHSKVSSFFMGGILHHLDALTAFLAPCPLSYHRLAPDSWSGSYKCWGYKNKEAPLRAVSRDDQDPPERWEIKTMDATSNPYLAIAAAIAAGIDGIRAKRQLPAPVQMNPSVCPDEFSLLPRSYNEAAAHLMAPAAQPIRTLIGEELVTAFTAVNIDNFAHFESQSLEEIVQSLLTRY